MATNTTITARLQLIATTALARRVFHNGDVGILADGGYATRVITLESGENYQCGKIENMVVITCDEPIQANLVRAGTTLPTEVNSLMAITSPLDALLLVNVGNAAATIRITTA